MADVLVLLPLGPGEFLALTPADLARARDRAREVLGAGAQADSSATGPVQSSEPLLTASQLSEVTTVPKPWFLGQARLGRIPHIKLGKYVRFKLSEVVQHGAVTPPAEAGGQWGRKKDKRP